VAKSIVSWHSLQIGAKHPNDEGLARSFLGSRPNPRRTLSRTFQPDSERQVGQDDGTLRSCVRFANAFLC
jgi:hypothetical protein